jgi:hypothetical protein
MKFSRSLFNKLEDNVSFKALAGPRESDLDRRGFDQNPIMVALMRSTHPSPNVPTMSSRDLEDYLIKALGVQRPNHASTSSLSLGGDVPQPLEAATLSPDDRNLVGKTLPRPSSYEGRDAGYNKPHPQEKTHAGLYSRGVAGHIKSFDASSKTGRTHSYLSNRIGVPKVLSKNIKKNGKFCNFYQYKNGIVTRRFVKHQKKTTKTATKNQYDLMSMNDFIDILSDININEEYDTPGHLKTSNGFNKEDESLKRSVKIICEYSRLLRTSRSALKHGTKYSKGTPFNYHTQQAFSNLMDQSLQLSHMKDPTGEQTFEGVNIPQPLFRRDFQKHQRNNWLQNQRNLNKHLRNYNNNTAKFNHQLPQSNHYTCSKAQNHIWTRKIPSQPMTTTQFGQHRN